MTTVDGETETAAEKAPLYQFGTPEERSRAVVHSLGLVAVAFLAGLVLVSLGSGVLDAAGLSTDSAPVVTEIATTGLYFVGLLGTAAFYLLTRTEASVVSVRLPTLRDAGWILLGFAALVATMLGLEFLLSELGFQPAENEAVQTGRENPQLFLFYLPLVVFLNAPAEELLFRGVVQGLFRRAYGIVPGILAASVIFGAVHYVALVGAGSKVAYVSIALASGLVLGAAYEWADNLAVPIAVHACWNILVYLNEYVQAV